MTFIQTLAVKSCEIRLLKSEMIKMSYIGILWLNIISDFFFIIFTALQKNQQHVFTFYVVKIELVN